MKKLSDFLYDEKKEWMDERRKRRIQNELDIAKDFDRIDMFDRFVQLNVLNYQIKSFISSIRVYFIQ